MMDNNKESERRTAPLTCSARQMELRMQTDAIVVDMNSDHATPFIARWQPSGGKELANYQSFLIELCTLLGVAPPEPTTTDDRHNSYVFERAVPSVKIDVAAGVCRYG